MIAFEKYLLDKGFIKMRYDFRSGSLFEETHWKHEISTQSNLDYRYMQKNDPEFQIIIGLHEVTIYLLDHGTNSPYGSHF
jgi:hypothetical protein